MNMIDAIKNLVTKSPPTVAQVEAELRQLTIEHTNAIAAYDADDSTRNGARVVELESALVLARHRLTSAQVREAEAAQKATAEKRKADLEALAAMVEDAQSFDAQKHVDSWAKIARTIVAEQAASMATLHDFNARIDAAAAEAARLGVQVALPPKQSPAQLREHARHAVDAALRALGPEALRQFPADHFDSPLLWLNPAQCPPGYSADHANAVIRARIGARK